MCRMNKSSSMHYMSHVLFCSLEKLFAFLDWLSEYNKPDASWLFIPQELQQAGNKPLLSLYPVRHVIKALWDLYDPFAALEWKEKLRPVDEGTLHNVRISALHLSWEHGSLYIQASMRIRIHLQRSVKSSLRANKAPFLNRDISHDKRWCALKREALFALVAMKLEEDLVLKSSTDEKVHFVFQQKTESLHQNNQKWTLFPSGHWATMSK